MVEVINELLEDMSISFLQKVFQVARFHYERNLDLYHNVKVRHLSDDHILEQINTRKGLRRWARVEGPPRYDFVDPQHRVLMDLLIDEAKYRGLMNKQHEYWVNMRDGSHEYRARNLRTHSRCIQKGGHEFTTVQEAYICTECGEKIEHEEVAVDIDRNLYYWMRKPGQ